MEHPFAPEACWRFAISSPFRVLRVDQLLNAVVRPVLEKRGLILECSNASDNPESHAFWMNSMKIMLELTDFHIFFQLGDTPQVEFERSYSKNVTRIGKAPALATNFELKRRKSRFFAPTVISIRDSWGLDRFSAWRGRLWFIAAVRVPWMTLLRDSRGPWIVVFRFACAGFRDGIERRSVPSVLLSVSNPSLSI